MKKTAILIILMLMTLNVFSQKNGKNLKQNREKMDALKIAHITKELNLTQSEAQAFWPIYNENENNRKRLRESRKATLNHEGIMNLTDSEAQAHLNKLTELEEQKEKQERLYLKKLTKVLSAKKILLLKNADRSFKRKVLEQLRTRRHHMRQEKLEGMREKRSELIKKREEKRDALENKREELRGKKSR